MTRRRKNTRIARPLLLLLAAAGLGLILWQLDAQFEERHWTEFSEAGTRALERGNYDWAEKMYTEALQYAQQQGNQDKEVQSYRLLNRLYDMQGEQEKAADMLARARRVGSRADQP
jgi:hypothetical protein